MSSSTRYLVPQHSPPPQNLRTSRISLQIGVPVAAVIRSSHDRSSGSRHLGSASRLGISARLTASRLDFVASSSSRLGHRDGEVPYGFEHQVHMIPSTRPHLGNLRTSRSYVHLASSRSGLGSASPSGAPRLRTSRHGICRPAMGKSLVSSSTRYT